VDVNEELVHAIHILQTSGHRGLLVTGEGKKPIGMLRLTDIYQLVKETIIED
jgi:predicted transcriptional regulator